MTSIEHLVEQHILENESHLKHLDEMLESAEQKTVEVESPSEFEHDLETLRKERDRLADHVEELRLRSLDDWETDEIEKAGPMGIWDALAQQVEKFIEKLERK